MKANESETKQTSISTAMLEMCDNHWAAFEAENPFPDRTKVLQEALISYEQYKATKAALK